MNYERKKKGLFFTNTVHRIKSSCRHHYDTLLASCCNPINRIITSANNLQHLTKKTFQRILQISLPKLSAACSFHWGSRWMIIFTRSADKFLLNSPATVHNGKNCYLFVSMLLLLCYKVVSILTQAMLAGSQKSIWHAKSSVLNK